MSASSPTGRPTPPFPGIDRIVTALRDIRTQSHRTRYGREATPELPSRTAIIEAVDDLIAGLFPRHFGPPGLPAANLDAFVTHALSSALSKLNRQIQLELELAAPELRDRSSVEAHALQIANGFAARLPEIRALLETDIRAAYDGDPASNSLDEVMSCYPGVTAVIRHRLGAPMLARIVAEWAHTLTGIDIHPGAEIGEAFFINHGTGVVIGETTVIGRRVRLYQGVTLGAQRFEIEDAGALAETHARHPIIEDDVVIYAGASILGRITIGQGSVISGGVWLTQSAPPGSRIAQASPRQDAGEQDGKD